MLDEGGGEDDDGDGDEDEDEDEEDEAIGLFSHWIRALCHYLSPLHEREGGFLSV